MGFGILDFWGRAGGNVINQIVLLIVGLGFLTWGAEWLVRGGSKLARAIGVSPLAIGLTIVAYGTSAPEMAVNIKSVATNSFDIAIGNIVGSNIFNVLFILGVCGLILPLTVASKLVKMDVPIMIATSILLYLFSLDGSLSRAEGFVFLALIAIYTVVCFRLSKTESPEVKKEFEQEYGGNGKSLKTPKQMAMNVLLIVLGLVLLVAGAKFLINSSIAIARHFGVSELVIALTIVAAGTSLPEVATSIMATIKGERDIAIGNVVGSNIFNILAILGVSAVMPSGGFPVNPVTMVVDIPFMIFVAVICFPIFRTGWAISRIEGVVFLSLYAGYTLYLINSAH